MRFHLLRHAETEANAKGMPAYEMAEPLNAEGSRQAERLVEYLDRIKFDGIRCSPLIRAKQTIAPFLQSAVRMKIEYDPLLCEGLFNLDASAPITEPEFSPDTGLPKETESLGSFRGRVVAMLSRLRKMGGDSTLLCVTHGHFIRELLNMLLNAGDYTQFAIYNCSDTLIELGDRTVIHYVNRETI